MTSVFAGYSEEPKPLGSYSVLIGAYNAGLAGLLYALRDRLPERIGTGDLALAALATHKLSRSLAKDKVTAPLRAPFVRYEEDAGPAEVSETPRGEGPRRAAGELLNCPMCLGQWVAAGFVGGLIGAPRVTRAVAAIFAVHAAADSLQLAYAKLEDVA